MPDLTERILLQAEDTATAILKEFGGTLKAVAVTLGELSDMAEIAGEYLASLGDAAISTGAGFDGLSDSSSVATVSVEDLMGAIDQLGGAAAEDTAIISALQDEIVNLNAQIDVLTMSEGDNAAASDAMAASHKNAVAAADGLVGTLGTLATVTGVAVVAGSALATKAAGDYQAEITSLSTGAGELQSNLKMVSDGVLQTADDTGESTKQLTDALYLIDSAGQHGKQSLQTLQDVAEGAKVGVADMGDVANGTTTIMTDYAAQNITSAQSVNTLIATVAAGKTHMGELSQSLAGVLPTASAAHVGLTDVMSAMATMTGEGVPAAQASTYLRQTLMALSAPSKQTTDALKSIGLTTQQVSDGLKTSLPNTLHMIMDALGKKFPEGSIEYQEALKGIAGGSKQLQGILDLTGDHFNSYIQNFDNIDNAVTGTKGSITGWNQVQGDFNTQMDKAKEGLETFGIKLGTQLMPLVTQLVSNVLPAIGAFGNWIMQSGVLTTTLSVLVTVISGLVTGISNVVHFFQQNHAALVALQAILIPVAGAIGGLLVFALVQAAIAAWGAAAGMIALTWPFLLVGAIIALVVAGIILAITHWGQIVDWLKGVWGHVVGFFEMIWSGILVGLHAIGQFFVNVWNGIVAGLQAAWNVIVQVVRIGIIVLLAIIFAPIIAIAALFIWLYQHNTYFKMMIDAIVNFIKAGIAWIRMAWFVVIAWLIGLWHGIVGQATSIWNTVTGAINIAFNAAIAFIVGVWTYISGIFSSAYDTYIAKPLAAAWNTVSDFFGGIWDKYIAGPIGDVWDKLVKTIEDLGPKALDAGKNFIKMLVDGIKSGAGAIWDAVTGIAGQIWKGLGFHSPAEAGPASDADEWMGNLISMLSADLRAGAPQIEAAAVAVATPLATNLGGSAIGITSTPTGSAGGGISITINVDGRSARTDQDLVNMLMDKLSRQLNRSGNLAPWISGGKA